MKRIILLIGILTFMVHTGFSQLNVTFLGATPLWDSPVPNWSRTSCFDLMLRPDLDDCANPLSYGPNNLFFVDNSNVNTSINAATFSVQTLILEAAANSPRIFLADGGGSINLHGGIVNNAATYHSFITPISLQASPVSIVANHLLEGVSSNSFVFQGPIDLGANELIFSGVGNTLVAANISGAGSVTLQGTGGLAISADNTYTGTTTISGGIFILAASLGSSEVIVESGATMIVGSLGSIDISINDLTINSGGTIQIYEGSTLTVNGDIVNDGSFTLESSATGTGSLITNGSISGSSSFNVERYMPEYSTNDDGWHFLSSPVASQAISAFHTAGSGDDFYKYDEPSGWWINRTASGGNLNNEFETNFEVGKGYLIAYQSPVTKSFTGSLNSSDVEITGLTNQGGPDDGWHLLGNPFPSAIQWNNNVDWDKTNIGDIIKIVVGATGNYTDLDVVDGEYIPAAQGFIVQVSGGTPGSLTIPTSARDHSTTTWYKSVNNTEKLKLNISGGSNAFSDIATIKFNEEATVAYDSQFDSHKFFGMETAPQLYTRIGEEVFSTNTFPNPELDREINLDFIPGTSGEHTIEVLENTVEGAESIYLHDLFTNQMIDLNVNATYTFTAEVNDNQERFKLVFGATGIQETQKQALQAYISGQNLYINGEEGQATLNIFDMQGKQLYNEQVELNSQFRKSLDLPHGIYVVSVQSSQVVKTAKIIIK